MGKIIKLSQYRKTEDGRTPLFVSHLDGTVKASAHFKSPSQGEFGDRIARIRTSLERINNLMAQLREENQ
tara:strand:- start:324 stop:533 length:210 start_codon:yes stop_codon:yes gene_type:complete